MKTLIKLSAMAILLFLAACKKESKPAINATLSGKWQAEVQTTDGTGMPVRITPPTPGYLQFNADGTLDGTVLDNYESYVIKDSATLVFTADDHTTTQNYRYTINGDELNLVPDGPIRCFDAGCGYYFTKAN
ncbi:lipocalin family protein [Mucilaginibacter sp.]|uniref:lipocalin family protein n=1 Tax=Mucilaginibacter sp. TaxID=1882438 RepID=UPI0032670EDB